MLVLGHLGFTVIAARLLRPLAWPNERLPLAFLLLGAVLPDLIDKPLGHAILGWDNGRLWAHTLAFALALAVAAWALGSARVGSVAFGTGLHHVQDQLPWGEAATWLWPLAGGFPRGVSLGVPDWIQSLLTDPYVWATEAIGLAALVGLVALPLLGLARRWWHPSSPPSSRRAPLGTSEASQDPEIEG